MTEFSGLRRKLDEAVSTSPNTFEFDLNGEVFGRAIQEIFNTLLDARDFRATATIVFVGPGGGNPFIKITTSTSRGSDAMKKFIKINDL